MIDSDQYLGVYILLGFLILCLLVFLFLFHASEKTRKKS